MSQKAFKGHRNIEYNGEILKLTFIEQKIYSLFKKNYILTGKEIIDKTAYARSTVFQALRVLEALKLIKIAYTKKSVGRGRTKHYVIEK